MLPLTHVALPHFAIDVLTIGPVRGLHVLSERDQCCGGHGRLRSDSLPPPRISPGNFAFLSFVCHSRRESAFCRIAAPPQPGCPIHPASPDGWDVNRIPAGTGCRISGSFIAKYGTLDYPFKYRRPRMRYSPLTTRAIASGYARCSCSKIRADSVSAVSSSSTVTARCSTITP